MFLLRKRPLRQIRINTSTLTPKFSSTTTSRETPVIMTDSTTPIHKVGTDDGWHGVIAQGSQFPPEKGRYHLYIGLFCPFAHRINLLLHLFHLTSLIDISVVKPYPKGDDKGWPGWCFPETDGEYEGATMDKLFGSRWLHEVYFRDDPEYKGRFSVPMVWDRGGGRVVCNESAELLRWLPTAFTPLLPTPSPQTSLSLYAPHLRPTIDNLSTWIQRDLNTGVYKAGFAPDQETYDKNVLPVFAALNRLEKVAMENGGPYLLGEEMTEVDVRVFATLIRFDTIYVQHFKCNLGSIRHNYPVLNNWLKNLYWNVPGFRETTDFRHIKDNYTKSHPAVNPRGITPMGPFPHVEEGVETDWSKLKAGGVEMREVRELEAKL
ncbi:glutathione S-transferase [Aulographum hederae CBS 113979]|uniref:Glutathione S-transferase n=1 Tax=Aulographum hederae CBS 113979 TaxID=1176131 RepID=A0A6G1H720_9PEZI|nr:glutathione S-transferase [Aulographum hederae CBS 113979]